MQNIQQANIAVIEQLITLLAQMTDTTYTQSLILLHQNTIGKHCRHIIEFYQALEKVSTTGIVDYDARIRDLRLETDTTFTINELQRLQKWCVTLQSDTSFDLSVTYGKTTLVSTTLSRELVYLLEHNIHHLAIIGIAITACFPHIQLPADFGVAYSTAQYRATATTETVPIA
ncbi:MAG TPA: hypothetical protein PKH93_02915 [Chitinophagales bacterium]|nr:hypothetical protein [Chitinophagales bacterium]